RVRVRLAPVGGDAVAVTAVAADGDGDGDGDGGGGGGVVWSVEALSLRPVSALSSVSGGGLYRVERRAVTLPEVPSEADGLWVLDLRGMARGMAPDVVRGAVVEAVAVLRERLVEGVGPVVVWTDGAVDSEGVGVGVAVWGLVRSVQREFPGRLVLVDGGRREDLARVVASGEPEVVLAEDGGAWVARLTAVEAPSDRPAGVTGAVLVSGGLGVLGGAVALHAVSVWGARDIVLLGRGGGDDGGVVARLEGAGARVRVVACDVADRAALAGALADVGDVRVVVHAAGVVDDGLLESLTPARVEGVLAAKVDGAWNLHEVAGELGWDLDAFVLFSSLAAVTGSAGQGAYGAGNAYLEALARHRHGLGLSGVSVAWGLWEAPSRITAGLSEADRARMRRQGVLPLETQDALHLLDTALSTKEPAVVAARLSARGSDQVPMVLREVVRVPAAPTSVAPDEAAELRQRIGGATPQARERIIAKLVRSHVAAVLGHGGPDHIDMGAGFMAMGLDSLAAVELRNRLGRATSLALPATLLFEHPTPHELTRHLDGELPRPEETTPPPRDPAPDEQPGVTQQSVLDTLESASADDVLDFIRREFGR
ncbi:beta-ketoacyl reductase, partial [Kitasatospora sp. NPDC058218]|uniref:type I polyketide synthase n=1 Tax=Kitasatospora sp. NPDC058218 TaxID=3346385 RepID=UPI0036D9D670